MACVRFQDISKRFGDVEVVSGLNLTIEDQEFFTFVGPSGCGKSTILNMIAGLEPITTGALYFDDERVDAQSAGERDIAMVFQSYALYPHMNVYENLAFPLRAKKTPKPTVDEKVRQTAALLGLHNLLRRKPKELSGGQRQRVALGRALVRKPRVFLMDEPLSNLDARLRVNMRAELKRLHQRYSITTAYVTHDQEEAMALSDRIAVLDQGRIQQCGTPQDLYRRPANVFVAGFIGSPGMNFIDGALMRDVRWAASLSTPAGRDDVVIGIRPADIEVDSQASNTSLATEVRLLEPTGGDTWVDGLWNGTHIKGRLSPDTHLNVGDTAALHIAVDECHVFDKQSGKRLT